MPSQGQLNNFTVVKNFQGFRNKRDVVKEERGVAVSGSQNIIIIDGEKIGVRPGFAYVGSRSTDQYGIQGGGSWTTSSSPVYMWRSFYDTTNTEGVIEVYINDEWLTLTTALTTGKCRTATWWSTTEVKDLLLFVEGTSNIYMWSGGVATFASMTANTITIEGTRTIAENRFLVSGTRQIRIRDTGGIWRTFTYTGGESTQTFTGVTGDPTVYSFDPGAPILQEIVTTTNKPSATYTNDFLAVYFNYLFVFNEESRLVLMSKNTDYTDFTTPSTPRVSGEAGVFTLDDVPSAAIVQPDGKVLYVATKNTQNYKIYFTLSDDFSAEVITVEPLKTSYGAGAPNSLAITNMKNLTAFVSGEPTIDTLGNIENIDTPQTTPLSDIIKNTMDVAGISKSVISYFKNNIYIGLQEKTSDPSNNRLLVRNLANGYWETPWTIPAGVIFPHENELYVHDPSSKNTYRLFDESYSDGKQTSAEGAPITAKWFSPHDDFGVPFNLKWFKLFYVDGYIRANTKITVYFIYDFGSEVKSFDILGTNESIIIDSSGIGGGLGSYNLGQRNLGSRGETLGASGMKRFRGFIPIPRRSFYELQVSFQSSGVGMRWEIVEYGMNIISDSHKHNTLKI